MNAIQYDEQLFAELYDVQPQAVVWMRPLFNDSNAIIDFEYVYSNEEGLNYLNLTRSQFHGLRISNSPTLTDALRKSVLEEMIHVYSSGEKSATTVYNPALQKHARVLRTKLRDGVLSIVQDISREQGMIRQLEEQKNLVDNILAHSSNGISVGRFIRDEKGKFVDAITVLANNSAAQHAGIPKEQYLSKPASVLDPSFIGSDYFKACVETLESGKPFVLVYHLESTDKWLEITGSRMDKDHLIHIFTDITTVKQAQIQSEQAAERLRAVFNAAQAGMFIFAPVKNQQNEVIDFRFVITNPTFAAYVAQRPEVLQGELGSTFFPGYLNNGVFDMYKETYLTGKSLRKEVHYNVDAHDLYLDLMSTRIHDEVLVTFTDHTMVKKSQIELERLVEELQRSNARLEEFAHAASHDLKEPMRKVKVFSDRLKMILKERLGADEVHMFDRMQNASERMSLLVDDLLNYSHVNTLGIEKEEVDLNKKLSLALSDLEVTIEEKKARITAENLPTVKGYRRQLQQLFQNLISNALKYSKDDVAPEINICYRKVQGNEIPLDLPAEQAYHLIEVKDNGIGFEQVYEDRIFQLFQRLHGRSEYAGTGVGLAIVKKVVENHNGYIWAKAVPGEGAGFFILLPA